MGLPRGIPAPGARRQGDHGRSDPWAGHEAGGGNPESHPHFGAVLAAHGKVPVLPGARGGGNPLGDLELDHEGHVRRLEAGVEEPPDRGGGDIVGEVPGHPQSPPRFRRGEEAEIEPEDIGLDHGGAFVGGKRGAEERDAIPIQFHGPEPPGALGQEARQRPVPGADFQEEVFGTRSDPAHNAVQNSRIS